MRSKKPRNKIKKQNILLPNNNKIDTDPVLLSTHKVIRDDGQEEEVLEIEIYCPVDKREFLKSDCDKITAAIGKTSPNTIKSEFKKTSIKKQTSEDRATINDINVKYKSQTTKEKENLKRNGRAKTKSKKNLPPKTINRSIRNAVNNKKSIVKGALKDYKKVGQFSFTPSVKDLPKIDKKNKVVSAKIKKDYERKAFGEKKVITPIPFSKNELINNRKSKKDLRKRNIARRDFRSGFKKFYSKNVISGKIDSASLFQDSYNKIGTKQKLNGSFITSKKRSRIFLDVFLGLRSEISDMSEQKFKLQTTRKTKSIEKLKTKISISKKLLMKKSKHNKVNVLLQGKNKKGINIQAAAISFDTDQLMKQKAKESQKFSLGVSRNEKGKSNVSIGKDRKEKASITLFAKPVTKTELPDKKNFAIVKQDVSVPNQNKKIKDGSEDSNNIKRGNFKPGQDVFYRGTLNFNEKNYSNLKCVVDRSRKTKSENLPNSSITAKVDNRREKIKISVSGIASNVLKVKPIKQKFKGKSLSDFIDLMNKAGEKIDYTIISDDRSITFDDYDVDDGEIYKYSLLCMMKNGERRLHYNSFVEQYETKSEIVEIKDISVVAQIVDNVKEPSLEKDREEKVLVQGSFVAKKIETDSDKILKTLFGNLFDLFQKDLEATIKDLQGLVYSVEVVRINKATGKSKTIDRVLVEENNKAVFEDQILSTDEVYYKFIPRVIPASDAISRVNDKISLIGPKEVFKKVNFGFASNRRKALNKENLEISKVGNKFNGRGVFTKGRIKTPEDDFEKNGFNFFSESSTGDIAYSEIVVPFERNKERDSYKIVKSEIKEIKHFKESFENIEDKKKIQQQLFDVSINTNDDYFVDFYMFFVKENNDIYLDGIMNSTDSIKPENEYNYLVEHKGSIGFIEYFLVAVFKTGTIDKPKKVGSHIIE